MTDLGKLALGVEPEGKDFGKKLAELLGGSEVAEHLGGAGKKAALIFASGFGVALGAGAILESVGSTFEKAYNTIRVGTGKTGPALASLDKSFNDVFSHGAEGAGEVGQTITVLNQKLGLTKKPLDTLATQILDLSRITKTDLGTNVQALTGLYNNWNVAGKDVGSTTDMLFRASQQSGVAVGDLASELASSGVQLRSVGLGLQDSTALLALLGKEGLSVSDVLPGINKSLALAAKEGKPAAAVFKDTFAAIRNAPNDTKAAGIALDVFGARAGPKLAGLIREGKLGYEQFATAIGKGDTIQKAADDTETWQVKLDKLRNNLETKLAPLGIKVFTGIGTAVDWVSTELGVAFGPQGDGTKAVTFFQGLVADLSAFWDQHGTQIIATAQRIEGDVVSAFFTIRTGVGDFITDVQSKGATFSAIGQKFVGVWQQLWPTVKAAFDLVVIVVRDAIGIIEDLWDRFGSHLIDHIRTAFNAVMQIASGVLQAVRGVIEIVTGLITLKWGKVWQGVKDVFGGVFNALSGIAKTALNVLSTQIGSAMAIISLAWHGVWSGFGTVVAGIWGGIERSAATGVNGIIDIINGLISAYNALPFVGNIAKVGHVSWGSSAPAKPSPTIGGSKPGSRGAAHTTPAAPTGSSKPGSRGVATASAIKATPATALAGTANVHIDASLTVEGSINGDAHLQSVLDDHMARITSGVSAGTRS